MSVVTWFSAAAESPMAQGVGVTIGAESGILARWFLVAAFGRTAPLAVLKGVTLYLVMGDGGLQHERSDWGDQVDGVIHTLTNSSE